MRQIKLDQKLLIKFKKFDSSLQLFAIYFINQHIIKNYAPQVEVRYQLNK